MSITWNQPHNMASRAYTCGYCGNIVAADKGYHPHGDVGFGVYICPHCTLPSYITDGEQVPGVSPGSDVAELPDDVEKLYREARNCIAASCYTAAVLTCRKLLMSIAVAQGAEIGKSFFFYVEFLADNGFIPPNGRGWVDHIRTKGNEANHEIVIMTRPDAEELAVFAEMLLKFIYEFPGRVPQATDE